MRKQHDLLTLIDTCLAKLVPSHIHGADAVALLATKLE